MSLDTDDSDCVRLDTCFAPPKFRYLRDSLFLIALTVYFVNRLVLKRIWSSGFVHDHMNDLICVAFWVPPLVWVQSRLGFRPGDEPPSGFEVTIAILIWTWAFEIVLPNWGPLVGTTFADPWDVMYYCVGGLVAVIVWNRSALRMRTERAQP
ncbi:MAG: hypothetical protein ACKVX7_09325 [Planctomycetota bacterium]